MKTYRISILTVLSLLLVCSIISLSLGWLTNYIHLDPGLDFSADAPDDLLLYEISYDEDANDNVTQTVTEGKETVGDGEFVISNLQFGVINNLSVLKNSNYVYYAIRVPKKNGDNISLGVSYGDVDSDGAHFTIYVPVRENGDIKLENGVMVTEKLADVDKLDKLTAIETNNSATFITYSFAISEKAPSEYSNVADMDALFEEALADSDANKSAEKKEHQMNAVEDDGSPTLTEMTYDTSSITGDYYYVYIKLTPNIDLYKYFIDYLWDSMPFYLAYEIRVKFDVKT
ncbi:MAG: hypothetical protein IJY65_02810 [Clostridia bacterium]|nr:hypothetical protein [Clostridia bacterium]